MIFFNNDSESTNGGKSKKDTQQDAKLSALQNAVDSLNSQIAEIESTVSAINSSISDKYSAQTQALQKSLTSAINSLKSTLATAVVTALLSADNANLKTLSVTTKAIVSSLVSDIVSVNQKLTAKNANIDESEIESLKAKKAEVEEAVIGLLNVTKFVTNKLEAEEITADTARLGTTEIDRIIAELAEIEKAKVDVISALTTHTPISTPNNTELLKIIVPRYDGVVNLASLDDEINLTVYNSAFVSLNQKEKFIYRIERTENSVDVYLRNVGEQIDYKVLFIGSESHGDVSSEIVDRTAYEQNVDSLSVALFLADGGIVSVADLQGMITGAASTIVKNDLPKNRVMISNEDGKADASQVTRAELDSLLGITRNVQEQLDEKQDKVLETPMELLGQKYLTVETSLLAIAAILTGLVTEEIVYNAENEELIFPYRSIVYDGSEEEITISGFNTAYIDEEITFSR